MPTPFPGMDPYLERRGLCEQVHTALIVAIQQYLTPKLRPRYRVHIEERTYLDVGLAEPRPDDLVGKPDVLVLEGERGGTGSTPASVLAGSVPLAAELPEEVTERFLQVRELASGDVVTVIEVLSPANRRPGSGRKEYEAKRLQVLGSWTHLVEIDLIRAGSPLPMQLRGGSAGDYRIVISRAGKRPRADVYAFNLRDPIPDFPVPLLPEDAELRVPLNQLLHELYDRAGYDLAIDYRRLPDPPLSAEDTVWAAELMQFLRPS